MQAHEIRETTGRSLLFTRSAYFAFSGAATARHTAVGGSLSRIGKISSCAYARSEISRCRARGCIDVATFLNVVMPVLSAFSDDKVLMTTCPPRQEAGAELRDGDGDGCGDRWKAAGVGENVPEGPLSCAP